MGEKHLEVIVDDSQLSLAIGKKGQNVRLAAKLLVWHIDIKSEEEKRQEIESQMAAMAMRGAPISELQGLGDKTLGKLREHGIESVEQLAQMTPEDLMQIQGVGEKTVDRIRRVVTDYFERDQSAAEAPSEVAEGATAESAETSEAPAAETAPESSPAEETAVTEEPTAAAESVGPETLEGHKPAEANDKIEPSGDGETQVPGEPGLEGTGGGEK